MHQEMWQSLCDVFAILKAARRNFQELSSVLSNSDAILSPQMTVSFPLPGIPWLPDFATNPCPFVSKLLSSMSIQNVPASLLLQFPGTPKAPEKIWPSLPRINETSCEASEGKPCGNDQIQVPQTLILREERKDYNWTGAAWKLRAQPCVSTSLAGITAIRPPITLAHVGNTILYHVPMVFLWFAETFPLQKWLGLAWPQRKTKTLGIP